MGTRRETRFDIGPLMRLAAARAELPPHDGIGTCVLCPHCYSWVDLATDVGMTDRAVRDWVRGGGVPAKSADRAATALGLHPLHLWPDFYDDILPEVAA